jgi:hypothetical protein
VTRPMFQLIANKLEESTLNYRTGSGSDLAASAHIPVLAKCLDRS